MMFGIVCDCHNTLINSNEAWIKAYTDFIGIEFEGEIRMCLYGKMKRRELAAKYNIEFTLVENRADMYELPNQPVIDFLNIAKTMGIPLFVVSNAPAYRVLKDMKITGIDTMFLKVYTGDNGGKANKKIFDQILRDNRLDYLLFLGNDEFDDHIDHEKVISFVITSFLRKRFDITRGYLLGDDGKISIEGENTDE